MWMCLNSKHPIIKLFVSVYEFFFSELVLSDHVFSSQDAKFLLKGRYYYLSKLWKYRYTAKSGWRTTKGILQDLLIEIRLCSGSYCTQYYFVNCCFWSSAEFQDLLRKFLSSNIGAQSQLVDPFGCAQDHIKHSLFLKILTWIAEEFFAVSFQDLMWWSKSHQSEVFPLNLQTACIVQDHSITSLKSKNLVIENLQDFWQIYFNTCLREF